MYANFRNIAQNLLCLWQISSLITAESFV